jgi:hypothetical protein
MDEAEVTDEAPTPRPRRCRKEVPRWVVALVFAGIAAGLGAAWYFGSIPENGVQIEDLKADAEQNLPPGTPREEVRAWLVRHGVTEIFDLRNLGGQVDGFGAFLPNNSWWESADISFEFRFDREGKLTRKNIHRARQR